MFRSIDAALIVLSALSGANAEISGATHEYYFVNGAKLYTESFGRGTPMLFLHGGLMFFDNAFAGQRDYFAAHHLVIGIDQRGHGHSPDGPWRLSYQLMADDTAAILRRLKVGPVDVVGHSDGGNIALLLARDHPELVRRVVISGANMRGWPPEVMEERRRSPAPIAEQVERLVAALPAFFSSDYNAVSPDGPDHWSTLVTKCYWLWGQPIVIKPGDLRKIQSPVLVMAGDRDVFPLEQTMQIFRDLQRGQLFIVPGTGHDTFTARPELVNIAISEFLGKSDDSQAVR